MKDDKKEVKELVDLIGACIIMHNLLIKNGEDDIPASWYDDIKENIDWSMYDEELEEMAPIAEDKTDQRKFVFNSLINNYFN